MKVLITGSNGFLGQALLEMLSAQRDIEIIACSKGPDRFTGQTFYTYAELDLECRQSIERLLNACSPDVIINAAALSNADYCESNPMQCRLVNVEALGPMIRYAERYHAHLIQLSTDFVFDGLAGPYVETDEPSPLSVYGLSKRDAELLLMASSCKWSVIRTCLVYGVPRAPARSNILLWALRSLRAGKVIQVVDDQVRSPTFVDDLAAACLLIARKAAEGVFHVSGAETCSVYDFVLALARFWHLNESLILPVSSPIPAELAVRPARTGFMIDKAVSQLGFAPLQLEAAFARIASQMQL